MVSTLVHRHEFFRSFYNLLAIASCRRKVALKILEMSENIQSSRITTQNDKASKRDENLADRKHNFRLKVKHARKAQRNKAVKKKLLAKGKKGKKDLIKVVEVYRKDKDIPHGESDNHEDKGDSTPHSDLSIIREFKESPDTTFRDIAKSSGRPFLPQMKKSKSTNLSLFSKGIKRRSHNLDESPKE